MSDILQACRPRVNCLFLSLIGLACLNNHSHTSAAPPTKPETKAPVAKDTVVEKPTLPFLTLMIARDPSVHSELALDPQQIEKVREAIAAVDQSLWILRDVPVERSEAQARALLDELRSRLKRDLNQAQLERLDQLILQARGIKALVSPEMVQRLKLTASQVTQLKQVIAELTAISTPPNDTTTETAKPVKDRNRSEGQRVTKILNSKQNAALIGLLGRSFDLSRIVQVGCIAPEIRDIDSWINSEPLTLQQLRGKVVVVHFWAFGCINCIRNLPHYQSWYEKFPQDKVTLIGFQTPETEAERNLEKLQANVQDRKIAYPVAFDLRSENWKAWGNDMWPSVYLIDKRGQVRFWWYGELNWQGARGEELMRRRIEQLLAEPD